VNNEPSTALRRLLHFPARRGLSLIVGSVALGVLLNFPGIAHSEEPYHTPLAGFPYDTTLFGRDVYAPARDRSDLTALDLGTMFVPNIKGEVVEPFGALYLWRNMDEGNTIFRAILVGVYNDIWYSTTPKWLDGANMVISLNNFTVPVALSEYVEGVEIDDSLHWYQWNVGVGVGYSRNINPGFDDNRLAITLLYEPGMLAFNNSSDTPPGYLVPHDTFEQRVHLRVRTDAMTRNIMEMAHHGLSGGLDVIYGNRVHWDDWGGDPTFGISNGAGHRNWLTATAYFEAAGGVPFVQSERHRLILRTHAGVGSHVDRFSTFRLSGGVFDDEAEDLSRVNLPASAFLEFLSDAYSITNLEYRYEALFFLYLHVQGSIAVMERYRFDTPNIDGPASYQLNVLPAVTAWITSGFIWNSELEVYYSHGFGILRDIHRNPKFGGDAVIVSWSKEF
jgi:hypothetical protein